MWGTEFHLTYKFVGTKDQIDDLQSKAGSSDSFAELYEKVVGATPDIDIEASISDIEREEDDVLTFMLYIENGDTKRTLSGLELTMETFVENYPDMSAGYSGYDSDENWFRNYDDGGPSVVLNGEEYYSYKKFFDDAEGNYGIYGKSMLETQKAIYDEDGSMAHFYGPRKRNFTHGSDDTWDKLSGNDSRPANVIQDKIEYKYSNTYEGWIACGLTDSDGEDNEQPLSLHLPKKLNNGGKVVGVELGDYERNIELWIPDTVIYIYGVGYNGDQDIKLHMENRNPLPSLVLWKKTVDDEFTDLGYCTYSEWPTWAEDHRDGDGYGSDGYDGYGNDGYGSDGYVEWGRMGCYGFITLWGEFDEDEIEGCYYDKLTLYVPKGAKGSYECDDRWGTAGNIIEEDYDAEPATKTEPKEEAPAAKVEEVPASAPKEEPAISNIYVGKNGTEQKGPYSMEQIQALKDFGAIDESSLVWYQGLAAWTELGKIDELK